MYFKYLVIYVYTVKYVLYFDIYLLYFEFFLICLWFYFFLAMAGLLANLGGNPLNTPVGQKIGEFIIVSY